VAQEPEQLSLAPAEWEIMKVLWERGSAAARDVYAALPKENSWAYKTVKTLLSRLVAKGAITYEQVGNSYLYRPAVKQEQMTRAEVRGLFRRIQGAALSPLLAHFIEEAPMTSEDIAALRKVLDEKHRQRSKKRGK
jgi:BlaI family penicillinase repressor